MFAAELLARAVQALSAAGGSWLAALTLGSVAVLPETRRLAQRAALARASLALGLVLGVVWAWSLGLGLGRRLHLVPLRAPPGAGTWARLQRR